VTVVEDAHNLLREGFSISKQQEMKSWSGQARLLSDAGVGVGVKHRSVLGGITARCSDGGGVCSSSRNELEWEGKKLKKRPML